MQQPRNATLITREEPRRGQRSHPWVMILAICVAWFSGVSRAAAHPQDGPHADLRIRIEPDGVRFSIGLNLAFLDEAGAPTREALSEVGPGEKDRLEAFIREFLRQRVTVEIDGIEVPGKVESLELWTEPDASMVALYPRMGPRALIRTAAVVVYPASGLPDVVRATWPVYPRDELAYLMEGLTGADGGPPRMFIETQVQAEGVLTMMRFSEPEPTIEWRSSAAGGGIHFEDVPVPPSGTLARTDSSGGGVALGLGIVGIALGVLGLGGIAMGRHRGLFAGVAVLGIVGAAAAFVIPRSAGEEPGRPDDSGLTEQQMSVVFGTLHRNLYRAFDYTDESDVYDALERSVSGDLLESLYEQIYQSLIDAEQDGMLGVITAVDPIETEILGLETGGPGPGSMRFSLEHTWRVAGTVYHWGHSHTRINEYDAVYTIAAIGEAWRIVDQEMRSQRRIAPGAPAGPVAPTDEPAPRPREL